MPLKKPPVTKTESRRPKNLGRAALDREPWHVWRSDWAMGDGSGGASALCLGNGDTGACSAAGAPLPAALRAPSFVGCVGAKPGSGLYLDEQDAGSL